MQGGKFDWLLAQCVLDKFSGHSCSDIERQWPSLVVEQGMWRIRLVGWRDPKGVKWFDIPWNYIVQWVKENCLPWWSIRLTSGMYACPNYKCTYIQWIESMYIRWLFKFITNVYRVTLAKTLKNACFNSMNYLLCHTALQQCLAFIKFILSVVVESQCIHYVSTTWYSLFRSNSYCLW